jgi:hypothetical protein
MSGCVSLLQRGGRRPLPNPLPLAGEGWGEGGDRYAENQSGHQPVWGG